VTLIEAEDIGVGLNIVIVTLIEADDIRSQYCDCVFHLIVTDCRVYCNFLDYDTHCYRLLLASGSQYWVSILIFLGREPVLINSILLKPSELMDLRTR